MGGMYYDDDEFAYYDDGMFYDDDEFAYYDDGMYYDDGNWDDDWWNNKKKNNKKNKPDKKNKPNKKDKPNKNMKKKTKPGAQKKFKMKKGAQKKFTMKKGAQKKFPKKKGAQKKFKKRQGPPKKKFQKKKGALKKFQKNKDAVKKFQKKKGALKKFQKKQCVKITFKLFLDDYPEDTTWKITSSDKNVLMAGGDYKYKKRHFIMKCVEPGCYTFEIKDSFGDGLALGGIAYLTKILWLRKTELNLAREKRFHLEIVKEKETIEWSLLRNRSDVCMFVFEIPKKLILLIVQCFLSILDVLY